MSAGSEILERVVQGEPVTIGVPRKAGPERVIGPSPTQETQNQRTAETGASTVGVRLPSRSTGWDPEHFAQQQIESLVQRVFFLGWPRPARQVLFSTVDDIADAGNTCARVSVVMAKRLPGTVCAIEADRQDAALERALLDRQAVAIVATKKGAKDGLLVQENLWLLSATEFFAGQNPSPAWLRNRLSELRREFDYIVIHCPLVATCSETMLVGQMADGVILVFDQQRTRRAAALEAQQILQTANARLLGVVLSEREFPIPEGIYSKL